MAQHLVLMLVDDANEDFKDQASLDNFVREAFVRGVHQTVSFRTYHNIPDASDVGTAEKIMDSVEVMQAEFWEEEG